LPASQLAADKRGGAETDIWRLPSRLVASKSDPLLAPALQKAIGGFQREADALRTEGQEVPSPGRRKQQLERTKTFQNPQGAVIVKPVTLGQSSTPRVVDHNDGTEFRF